MVCVVGFEPTASHFQGEVSTRLTYTQIVWRTPRDSNPDEQFWRLSCCHYIRDALVVLLSGIEPASPAYKTGPHPLKVSRAYRFSERLTIPPGRAL